MNGPSTLMDALARSGILTHCTRLFYESHDPRIVSVIVGLAFGVFVRLNKHSEGISPRDDRLALTY